MKFRFQATQGHRVRKGTLEAPDLETAEAMLERKNLTPLMLEVVLQEPGKNGYYTALALCLLGVLIVLLTRPSSIFTGGHETRAKKKPLTLRVEGRVLNTSPDSEIKLVAAFPELPTRIQALWKDVAQEDGSFVLESELVSSESPHYFHFFLLRDKKTIYKKKSLEYSVDKGGAALPGPINIRRKKKW